MNEIQSVECTNRQISGSCLQVYHSKCFFDTADIGPVKAAPVEIPEAVCAAQGAGCYVVVLAGCSTGARAGSCASVCGSGAVPVVAPLSREICREN